MVNRIDIEPGVDAGLQIAAAGIFPADLAGNHQQLRAGRLRVHRAGQRVGGAGACGGDDNPERVRHDRITVRDVGCAGLMATNDEIERLALLVQFVFERKDGGPRHAEQFRHPFKAQIVEQQLRNGQILLLDVERAAARSGVAGSPQDAVPLSRCRSLRNGT